MNDFILVFGASILTFYIVILIFTFSILHFYNFVFKLYI